MLKVLPVRGHSPFVEVHTENDIESSPFETERKAAATAKQVNRLQTHGAFVFLIESLYLKDTQAAPSLKRKRIRRCDRSGFPLEAIRRVRIRGAVNVFPVLKDRDFSEAQAVR
ncbi:hypothetical protein, partial [Roseibium sp. RKSG952]|uniref:hypothetical protein n=1 Tax=Roseibium sp. RKSG952 TaxID=2529384 RepID=UPI0034CF31FC